MVRRARLAAFHLSTYTGLTSKRREELVVEGVRPLDVADRLDDDLGLERLRLDVLERLRDLGDHRGVLTVEAGHVALHGAVDLAVEAGDAVVLWVALDRRAVLEDRVVCMRSVMFQSYCQIAHLLCESVMSMAQSLSMKALKVAVDSLVGSMTLILYSRS